MTSPERIQPSVDFSRISESYEGKWILVRVPEQEILGSGDTPREAIRESGSPRVDPSLCLARVPHEPAVLFVQPRPLTEQS